MGLNLIQAPPRGMGGTQLRLEGREREKDCGSDLPPYFHSPSQR